MLKIDDEDNADDDNDDDFCLIECKNNLKQIEMFT